MNYILPKKFPLLPRKKNTDKGSYGHTLIIAGSTGYTGAAILSSLASLRSGSGLVTLGTPKACQKIVSKRLVEVMTLGLKELADGSLSSDAYYKIMDFIIKRRVSAVALGPGLALNADTGKLVRKLVQKLTVPVVLDADGLNHFKGHKELLLKRKSGVVLTPHPREFERLFETTLPKSGADRIRLAKKLSKFYHVVLVLKGFGTLVVAGDSVYKNNTGNPGMAKGGSGDVLTGMIAAFLSQGLGLFEATTWAVYFHGKAGDIAVRKKGELSLVAMDLVDCLPHAFTRR